MYFLECFFFFHLKRLILSHQVPIHRHYGHQQLQNLEFQQQDLSPIRHLK